MEKQYLILSPDGTRASMFLTDRAGLEKHLEERAAAEAAWQPRWLEEIPTQRGYRTVDPGTWGELDELILEVKVVMPQPVTTKWALP